MRFPVRELRGGGLSQLVVGFVDFWDGDREPGEWTVGIEFEWRPRSQRVGFRGLAISLGRWGFVIGEEFDT